MRFIDDSYLNGSTVRFAGLPAAAGSTDLTSNR
jgi:hypothetical protein